MSHNVWLQLVGALWLCPPTRSVLGSSNRVAGVGQSCRDSPTPPGRQRSPKNCFPQSDVKEKAQRPELVSRATGPRPFKITEKEINFKFMFRWLFRWLSCRAPLLAHVCAFGVWSPANPSCGGMPSCKRNPHCHWCEGLCVKNKNTVLSKKEKGSRVRSVNPCLWQTWSATWRRCCCNRTVEGWAGVSRHVTGMTSCGSRGRGRWTRCQPFLGVSLTWAPK